MSIQPYLSLITSEYADKPNFMAWLTAPLQMINDGMSNAAHIPIAFDISHAVGAQLDVLGQIIGIARNVGFLLPTGTSILDDTHYQQLLLATIAKNNWVGTIPSIYALWNQVFPNEPIAIADNQNMTMTATINGWFDPVSVSLIGAGLIVPKPMGVLATIILQYALSDSLLVTDSVSSLVDTPGNGQLWGSGRKWGQGHWYPPTQYAPPSSITTNIHELVDISDNIAVSVTTPPYTWGANRTWGQSTYST